MREIDVSVARDRDALPDNPANFLPDDLQIDLLSVPSEVSESIMQFALKWGQLAVNAQKYEQISPLDSRYADNETRRYLGDQTRIRTQALVYSAVALTAAEFGLCSEAIAEEICDAVTQVRAEEVNFEELGLRDEHGDYVLDENDEPVKAGTGHDIKALANCITPRVSDEAKPFVGIFATSYDIVAPADTLRYRETMNGLIIPRLVSLETTLIDMTERYADVPQIGRSHGQHGEPITFGFELSHKAVGRLGKSIFKIKEASDELVGKFSGAMGAYNTLATSLDDPEAFERAVLAKLGLKPVEVSGQVVPGENMKRLLDELENCAAIMADLANDMRNLQRTEIEEVREYFDVTHQTGSHGMPHKRNPITFENIASLERVVKHMVAIAADNVQSEHQRDLRDSGSSRFYVEPVGLVAVMVRRLDEAMQKMEVDPVNMLRNLHMGGGKIASGVLQTELRTVGHPKAHDAVRAVMAKAEEMTTELGREVTFLEALSDTKELRPYIDQMDHEARERIYKPEKNTGIAEKKARDVAANWRQRIAELQAA